MHFSELHGSQPCRSARKLAFLMTTNERPGARIRALELGFGVPICEESGLPYPHTTIKVDPGGRASGGPMSHAQEFGARV